MTIKNHIDPTSAGEAWAKTATPQLTGYVTSDYGEVGALANIIWDHEGAAANVYRLIHGLTADAIDNLRKRFNTDIYDVQCLARLTVHFAPLGPI